MSDVLDTILQLDENILAAILLAIGVAVAYVLYFRDDNEVASPIKQPSTPHAPVAKNKAAPRGSKHLALFFGSQTGTAEDFARTVAKDAKKAGFETSVIDLEDYDHETNLESERLCIFFMATYGEGEPTDNAKEFWDWLQDAARDDELDTFKNLKFAVFGLGNKTYEFYNSVGKYINKRLDELGAERLVDLGLGDDDATLEDDFEAWRENLLEPFCDQAGISKSSKKEEKKFETSFVLRRFAATSKEAELCQKKESADTGGLGSCDVKAALKSSKGDQAFDVRRPLVGKIVVNRELHTDLSDRSCRHIEIETNGLVTYETGDHVGVFAENDPELVESLAARLNLDLNEVVSLEEPADNRTNHDRIVLGPASLRHIFTRLVEPNAAIRKKQLVALAQYTTDEKEQAQLKKWASNTDLYNKEVKEACRTIPELLQQFSSLNPPLDVLLELLPPLAPRYYSLSSAPNAHGSRLHVTAIVVKEATSTGRILNGLCTSFFQRIAGKPDYPVACFVRKSNFKLPEKLGAPMLMIGPGTGLAPFRGFIHDIRTRIENEEISQIELARNDSILYYGCRRKDTDALYPEELEAATKNGVLSELIFAESRLTEAERVAKHRGLDLSDQDALKNMSLSPKDDIEKHLASTKYVQHHLKQPKNSARAAAMLANKDSRLYICGDARVMAKDVHEALKEALAEHPQHMHQADAAEAPLAKRLELAEQYLTEMTKESRYLKDVWS